MFYVVAKNSEGKQFVLSSNENTRIKAQLDIQDQAAYRGLKLNVDEIRVVSGKGKQGGTTTKFYKNRRVNGSNGKGYERAL